MTKYIDAHRDRFGVEPICQALAVAPSTYYAARTRPPSARACRDAELRPEVTRVHRENFGVYGVDKVWHQLNREGFVVGRDRVARLMRACSLRGVRRGAFKRTTQADEHSPRPADLVEREFRAAAPNRLSRRRPHVRRDLAGLRLRRLRHRRL